MKINEQILCVLLEYYGDWWSSPEDFLTFITLADHLFQAEAALLEQTAFGTISYGKELAEIMLKVLEISIYPYQSFSALKEACTLKEDILDLYNRILERVEKDDELNELTAQGGILPSEETMIRQIENHLLAEGIINRLRPFIDFR